MPDLSILVKLKRKFKNRGLPLLAIILWLNGRVKMLVPKRPLGQKWYGEGTAVVYIIDALLILIRIIFIKFIKL